MGGKKDAAKKGAVAGGYKAGKPHKDILPANSKPPREPALARLEGEPEVQRQYEFEPLQMLPEWPGNDEAKAHDFKAGFEQDAEGNWTKYTEPEAEDGVGAYHLPPSFADHCDEQPVWMRPEEYIREILYEQEVQKRRKEKKRELKLRKTTKKNSLMALAAQTTVAEEEEMQKQELELEQLSKAKQTVVKEEIVPEPKVIAYQERLETENEVARRKELAEKAAAADKGAKKKAPAKGAPAADPADEPQMIQVPIDGSLDMSFAMPTYVKWVTSQFQFCRDRTIRDIESNETIWQRIYPQENGIPKVSPTGKYWVKLRFMGKERLVEIDDRVPCNAAGQPIFPRTTDPNEIWPQLLMKALLKIYSYKWYAKNCHYDSEIGDGSIVYSLTGLIPEKVPIRDLEQAQGLFRKYLADDYYFGKRAYLTAYCENDFRPKFPSQITALKGLALNNRAEPGSGAGAQVASADGGSDTCSETSAAPSSSQLMLSKLKEAASLAISVTTGRKPAFGAKEKNLTNIIPGFGYALMDVFENEFVDMESLTKQKNAIVEENASPFASPAKSKSKRDKSMSKDEYRKHRKEERKKNQDEFDRREKMPPAQYGFVKIKTSIGKHPVINYLSTFTNDEIMEGKKHLINHWRRDPTHPAILPYRSPSPGRRGTSEAAKFKIDVSEAVAHDDKQQDGVGPSDAGMKTPAKAPRVDPKNALLPKTRGAGGLWLTQSDFPHAFQNILVYHNVKKYQHCELHQDIWDTAAEPYIVNDKEVYIKLEIDPEAAERVEAEQAQSKYIGVQKPPSGDSDPATQRSGAGEESKEQSALDEAGGATQRSGDHFMLPGEREKPAVQHDNILIACAPYPTNKAHPTLPRYLTRVKQVDCEIPDAAEQGCDLIDQNYSSYFGGCQFKVLDQMSSGQNCIWLKPEFNCPQGATLWIASQLRKIKIMSKVEYLQEQAAYHVKQVTFDYQPMQADKYQMLAKYDFTIPEPEEGAADVTVQLKVDTPADRYLLNYMRIKIIDRSPSQDGDLTETSKVTVVNQVNLSNLKLPPNGPQGYTLIVEGVFPYNTGDGQLVLETLSNSEAFELKEVTQCEPVEYTDAYTPTKYGIIFKEKIVISPVDHTSASLNIKLMKGDQEFAKLSQQKPGDDEEVKESELHKPKYFRIDVLDNGNTIYSQTGYDQITLSHFMFRCNQGLPDQPGEDGEEVKHNYVIQALFDLHEWPECKTVNEKSQDISWCIKVYSSETLALIKDTDKEDRERELKASWEAEEPGRAEKAKLSRTKFLLKQKQKQGEELTEEELATLNEKRERVRKKDQEDAAAAPKGGKGGKAPAKGGKAPAKGAPVQEEVEEAAPIVFPEAFNHVNNEIKEFLEHFASSRKIMIPEVSKVPRKRSDEEKESAERVFSEQLTQESDRFSKISEEREQMKEKRAEERELAFKDMDDGRNGYKDGLKQVILEERNGYRDKIEARKAKETELVDLIKQDKDKDTMPRPDLNALKAAIEAAEEMSVKPKYIKKGQKYCVFIEYVISFEQFIQQAVADKNKESLTILLERVEHEGQVMGKGLPFEPKILADAKGNLAKMK